MEITSAQFVTSLAQYGSFQGIGLKQIAIVGKSNVGKSSLLNNLCAVKGLAKISGTPGKTRLINVFLINEAFHLIDLPGYGYAKVSKQEQARWFDMMEGYFSQTLSLNLILHLIDIRHEPSKDDLQMNRYLYQSGLPFQVIATKADKLSRAQRQRALPALSRALAVQPWDIIQYSAQTGDGREQLLHSIGERIAE